MFIQQTLLADREDKETEKKKLIRNDIGCTGKIKTSLTFVFLSFLTQWPTLLFFPFYSFFCLHKHYRWTKQIDKCGKFMRNKDSNSKDKAKQTWQMTSQKGKSDFLEKIPSLKRLCFTYLTTDLKGTFNT